MSETTIGLDTSNGAGKSETIPAVQTRGTVTNDPKLVACIKIAKALDGLSVSDRTFVLDYVAGRYNV